MRNGHRLATFAEILRVGAKCLLDPLGDLGGRGAERDNAGQIRKVGTPSAVIGLLVDHDILAHRSSSRPLARLMLPSVPAGTVSLGFPATTMRSRRSGCAHTSCEPRCRARCQPAATSANRTSR